MAKGPIRLADRTNDSSFSEPKDILEKAQEMIETGEMTPERAMLIFDCGDQLQFLVSQLDKAQAYYLLAQVQQIILADTMRPDEEG